MHQQQSQLAALREKSDSVAQQHSTLVDDIRQLNSYALTLDELQREVDLLDKSCRAYSENLEQARIDTALERERITNVNVVQEATLAHKPVGPKQSVAGGLGLLAALSAAVGIALLVESCDRNIRSVAEAESLLTVPVLVAIPASAKQSVHVS